MVNLHIKDFTIRRRRTVSASLSQGAPVGQGMLDIPKLLRMIQAHGRDMNAILEQWPASEATLDATTLREAAAGDAGHRICARCCPRGRPLP
ncbi:MAG: hypothetical protein R2851_27855 [Caldilineaceae bacterium]